MTGILFDLDGTLLDTLEDLADATNHILAQYGYPTRSMEEIRRFVGNGAGRLISQAVPEGKDPDAPFLDFGPYYAAHCRIKTHPYPGIAEALNTLSAKYPVAIVSNKPDNAVKPLCAQYFPGLYAQGETAGIPRKPAPDMIYSAMKALNINDCIYVGDSEVDVLTSRNAGVRCLSVLWGFRDRDVIEAAGGSAFCDSPDRLVSALEAMLSQSK